MKKKFFLLIFMLGFFHIQNVFGIEVISIAGTNNAITNYKNFTQGKVAADIDNFVSEHCIREVVDIILVLKALKIAGFPDVKIHLEEMPNSARERSQVKSGTVVLSAQDHWKRNFDDSVYITDPIIRDGEFEKGIYFSPNPSNYELLHATTLKEIQKYSAVMVKTWYVDWETLEEMKLKELTSAPTAASLFKVLEFGRAHFTLYEFSNEEDFSRTQAGTKIRLIPVPGIKVGLKGSRHLMISKNHPQGKAVYDAVQKGLKVLRNKGIIRRAMTECGFFEKRVSNWKKIN